MKDTKGQQIIGQDTIGQQTIGQDTKGQHTIGRHTIRNCTTVSISGDAKHSPNIKIKTHLRNNSKLVFPKVECCPRPYLISTCQTYPRPLATST